MTHFQAGRLVAWLGPLLLLAACGWSGTHHATRELDSRLQTRLAPAITANRATLQRLPAGARVSLPAPPVVTAGKAELDDNDRFVLDSVIEALLDPSLMRIEVADPSAASDSLRAARVRNVTQYFVDYGLGMSLQPAGAAQGVSAGSGAAPPSGLTITINVVCPHYHGPPGYDYSSGRADPSCN